MSSRGYDLYQLLDVRRDATQAEIRRAYEIALNRAHRDGAIRHAEDLVRAFDTLGDVRRRELYDRHGLTAMRERVPGTAAAPVPWRATAPTPRAALPARRRWRWPATAIFALGIVAGLVIALVLTQQPRSHPPSRAQIGTSAHH